MRKMDEFNSLIALNISLCVYVFRSDSTGLPAPMKTPSLHVTPQTPPLCRVTPIVGRGGSIDVVSGMPRNVLLQYSAVLV